MHHWVLDVYKMDTTVLILKPFLSQIRKLVKWSYTPWILWTNQSNFKTILQSAVRNGNSITWGNTSVGVLPHDLWCHISEHSQQIPGIISHDDVIKWKHFPRNWPFVRGIHRSPVNSPHKGQWRGALMFSLICVGINDWVNNREAGDLRRYRAHYDVIVMMHIGQGLYHSIIVYDKDYPHFRVTPLYCLKCSVPQ